MVCHDPATRSLGGLRSLIGFGGLALSLSCGAALAAAEPLAPAVAPAAGLCEALLASMKAGKAMDFPARDAKLAPEIDRDLNLPFMTRIVVGPPWRTMTPADQQALVKAFGDYSVATYAQRFKSYSGERFEVDPAPVSTPAGDAVVHTKLFTAGGGDPVQLDYRVRKSGEEWKIIDIYLSGTISELAARRSEYSTILRQGGAPALISLLRQKTADLAH